MLADEYSIEKTPFVLELPKLDTRPISPVRGDTRQNVIGIFLFQIKEWHTSHDYQYPRWYVLADISGSTSPPTGREKQKLNAFAHFWRKRMGHDKKYHIVVRNLRVYATYDTYGQVMVDKRKILVRGRDASNKRNSV